MQTFITVLLIVLGIFTICAVSVWIEILTASKKDPLSGLALPFVLFAMALICTVAALIFGGPLAALVMLYVMNIPLILTLVTYLVLRKKRYRAKLELYRAQNQRPVKHTSLSSETRTRIVGFFDPEIPFSAEVQREILIRLKKGTFPDSLAALYGTGFEVISRLSDSFEAYCTKMTEQERGIIYSLSEKQKDLFLQLMITSSPRALGASDELLWTKHSLRTLISDTLGINISLASVEDFLKASGLYIPREMTVAERKGSSEFERFAKGEFERIRMRSLEEETEISFVYSVAVTAVKGKRLTMLASVPRSGIVSFGVYRGEGGHKDFIDKLTQENGNRLFVIIDGEELYKRFSSIKTEAEIFCIS